jgi:hypothetical protein
VGSDGAVKSFPLPPTSSHTETRSSVLGSLSLSPSRPPTLSPESSVNDRCMPDHPGDSFSNIGFFGGDKNTNSSPHVGELLFEIERRGGKGRGAVTVTVDTSVSEAVKRELDEREQERERERTRDKARAAKRDGQRARIRHHTAMHHTANPSSRSVAHLPRQSLSPTPAGTAPVRSSLSLSPRPPPKALGSCNIGHEV